MFSMFGVYESYYQAIIKITDAMLRNLDQGINFESDFKEIPDAVNSILKDGYYHTRTGRRDVRDRLKEIKNWKVKDEKEKFNRDLVTKMFSSFYQTFDIGDKMLETVEGYLRALIQYDFNMPDDVLNDFSIALTALETEFSDSNHQRQKLLTSMK